MTPPDMDATEKTLQYFQDGYNCAQSVLLAHLPVSSLPPAMAARLMSGFGGGVGKTGGLCGALSALVALIGLAHGREEPGQMDRQAATYQYVRAALKDFEVRFGATDCRSLLRLNIRHDGVKEKARDDICPRFLEYTCQLAAIYAKTQALPEEEGERV